MGGKEGGKEEGGRLDVEGHDRVGRERTIFF